MKSFYFPVLLTAAFLGLIIFSSPKSAALNDNLNKKGNDLKSNISDIIVKDMNNNDIRLSDYKGKVLLIVNVASKCGYTKQYKGLQEIYDRYKKQGFEILAFPCNQFGGQEPGTNEQIAEFCSTTFGVTFKLFDKIDVNGKNRSPLYERLTNNSAVQNGEIKWNFEKFLISKTGEIIARYASGVEPTGKELLAAIEGELKK